MKPIQAHRARLLPIVAAVGALYGLAGLPAQASSHREAPAITATPKVDGTDFYMFNSYEPGRSGFVTLVANYLPLQDGYGGPNYFKLDANALYEIHIDNNGDGKEDITFQFRFNNALKGVTLPINGTNVAIPLTQAGQVSAPNAAALNVNETFTVDVVRGDRRIGVRAAVTNAAGGSATFAKPSDNIGVKTIPDYAAYAAQHVYTVNIPGCSTPGKVFVGQRKDPFAVNLGVDLRPDQRPRRGRFQPGRGGVPARSGAEGRRRRRPARQERDRARDRGADQLPARRRRRRSGDRRLDHGQPAPGVAAQQRAQERLRHLGDRRRRLDPGLAPRPSADQRGRSSACRTRTSSTVPSRRTTASSPPTSPTRRCRHWSRSLWPRRTSRRRTSRGPTW